MIKLKKYGIYKVKHLAENNIYIMLYLGKSKVPLGTGDNTHYQLWSLGSFDTLANRKAFRKKAYNLKKNGNAELPSGFNHEHTLEVLEEIPLSSIKMGLWELKYNNVTQGSAFPYKKAPKDYSKLRILNL